MGDYIGMQVAVKVLKDTSMVQQFLAEAYVMTYVTLKLCSMVLVDRIKIIDFDK